MTIIAGVAVVGCAGLPLIGLAAGPPELEQTAAHVAPVDPAWPAYEGEPLFLLPGMRLVPMVTSSAAVASTTATGRPGAEPVTRATIASRVLSVTQVLRLVKRNFPADQVGNAMAVASCESGQSSTQGEMNSDGTTDWGVFQLNDGGTLQGAMRAIGVPFSSTAQAQVAGMNAELNIRAAAHIWADRGWSPWVCAYKQQIVAALYTNVPGPMYGKFTAVGDPTRPFQVGKIRPPGNHKPKHPSTAKKPTPKPKPSPAVTDASLGAKPTPSPTATASTTPSQSHSPSQSGSP